MARMYTPKEIAEIFEFSHSYICRLARLSRKEGYPYPQKRGRAWEATLEEWYKVLHPKTEIRKPRKPKNNIKEIKTDGKKMNLWLDEEYSANKAAKILKVTPKWLLILGKRSIEKGNGYPRIGRNNTYLATLDEWKRVLNDPSLKAWSWKKNN